MSVLKEKPKEKPKDTFRRRRELLEICINTKSMSNIDTFKKKIPRALCQSYDFFLCNDSRNFGANYGNMLRRDVEEETIGVETV